MHKIGKIGIKKGIRIIEKVKVRSPENAQKRN
jgi:hypothetical protein